MQHVHLDPANHLSALPGRTRHGGPVRAAGNRIVGALLVLASVLFYSEEASSQSLIEITGGASCRECRVDLRRIALLGPAEGEGALTGEPTSVSQDRRGNYYVTQFRQPEQILVFHQSGRFLRSIGRAGRGPGEFNRIAFVRVGAGDSLYVFDQGNARLTVLSPQYEFARSATLAGIFFSAAFLPQKRIVANAHLPSPQHVGQPLRTLSFEGTVQGVYGARDPVFKPNVPYSVMRSIASAGDSSVWSGYKTKYTVEEWSTGGTLARILNRTVTWFKPYQERSKITQSQPADPWLMALHQDAAGLLWTAVSVPTADWRNTWSELGIDEAKGVSPDQRMFDTMIEVLDPRQRTVLVSQRLPQYVLQFMNDSTSYAYSVDADEIPHIEIWRFRLARGR